MYRIVRIKFQDLCQSVGWTTKEDIPDEEDLNCIAVGFLISEDDKLVTIAQAIGTCDCGDVLNPFTIPRVNIQEMEVIADGDIHT